MSRGEAEAFLTEAEAEASKIASELGLKELEEAKRAFDVSLFLEVTHPYTGPYTEPYTDP